MAGKNSKESFLDFQTGIDFLSIKFYNKPKYRKVGIL